MINSATIKLIAVLFVVFAAILATQAQKEKVDKNYLGQSVTLAGVEKALKMGIYTNDKMTSVIETLGVNFKLNTDAEKSLRDLGATEEIISAIKANFRADDEDRSVSSGIVNGKAKHLALPPYPPAARAVRASGAVNVLVIISKQGDVVSATAVSGHPLLRAAAEAAARTSEFEPTTLGGKPIAVKGIIVFNFVP